MFKHTILIAAVTGLVLAAGAMSANAAPITLFYDNFSGSAATNLNTTTPDTTIGTTKWVAVNGTLTDFNADGSFVGGGTSTTRGGSATLAFTPANGLVYTLEASLSGVTGDTNWIALGFAKGQSATAGTNYRFISNTVIGKAWMLARGTNDDDVNKNVAWLGTSTGGAVAGNGADWAGGPTGGGDIDMRIVLDTRGGAGAWTATWYAKRPIDADYTKVRDTATLLNEDINSVGFAVAAPVLSGTIESFKLTSDIPEPATLALLGIGGLALLRRRHR